MSETSGRGFSPRRANTFNCPKCSQPVSVGDQACPNCGTFVQDMGSERQPPTRSPNPKSGSRVKPKPISKPVPKRRPDARGSLSTPSNVPVGQVQPGQPGPPQPGQPGQQHGSKPMKPSNKRFDQKKPGTAATGSPKKVGYWSKLDRSEIRRIKYYVFTVQIIIIVLFILNAMYESTITLDKFFLPHGFYFPLGYLLLFILLLLFLIAAEGLWFKYIQIKIARSFEKRNKLIKNYQRTAQSVLVTTIIILIVLLSLNYFPFITDALKTEDSFEIGANEEESNFFEEQDAFGLTQTNSITINSNNTVELNLIKRELMKDMEKSKIKNEDLGNHSNKDVSLSASEFQLGYTPNKKYYFFINNIGNSTVSGKLIIGREISKPFIFNVVFFMLLFIITSAIWLAYLGVIRKKYEKLHDEKVTELTKHYAVKPYTLEDVFLIYMDGTLINHQTRRIKPMDNDILSGMLTAIKDFVKDAFQSESKGELNELKYGKLKIMIEHGEFAFLAAVVSGTPPKYLKSRMKQVINQINRQYYQELKNYKGEVKKLAAVKKIIHQYLTGAEDAESNFDETSDSAWNNRGVVLTKLGKYNDSLECFDKALKINPGVSNVWLNRGIALNKLYEFDEAMDCFDRALQLDPNNTAAQRRRNKCWYKWHLQDGREQNLMAGARKKPQGAIRPAVGEDDYYDQPPPRREPISRGAPAAQPGPAGLNNGYHDEPGYADDYGGIDEPPPRCTSCGQPLAFVETYESWYCKVCDIYPYDE